MKRVEKEEEVKSLSERFKGVELMILADYCGLTAGQMSQFRKALRESQAEVKVVKNSLAQRAIEDTELKALKEYFVGTVAAITATTDPVGPAKALVKLAKDFEKLQIKVGYLSGKVIDKKEVEALSKLPSREEMISSLLGSLQAPAQSLVGVLSALTRKLVYVLAAIRDKKEQ